MLILPAIDLLKGECVRLTQGDYGDKVTYSLDAVSVALSFVDAGAQWIHIVDLDGALSGDMVNLKLVEEIAHACSAKIELGGGIRSKEAARRALNAGVARVVIGSKVIQDPELAQEMFTELGEQAVAGLDARNGQIAISGWTRTTTAKVEEVAQNVENWGARRIVLTDIAKDGMLQGPNLDLLHRVLGSTTIPIIQSGGISGLQDVRSLLGGVRPPEGVIVGKAIYENCFDLGAAIKEFQGPP